MVRLGGGKKEGGRIGIPPKWKPKGSPMISLPKVDRSEG